MTISWNIKTISAHDVVQGQAYVPGQAISILHPRLICIFKNFVATYPSYKQYFKKFHRRFIVKNLEF